MLMVYGKLQAYNSPDDLKNLWEKLTKSLNSCMDGPVRTLLECKKADLVDPEEKMEGEIEGAIEKGTGTRKTTNYVPTNAYQNPSSEQAEGLNHIADAILEVAKAINRYCDICENILEETKCNLEDMP
ncbi:hypothetical protein JTB14_001709 [Gonioctena quinquepunctata]|nr:hypothetical protein JTB14_001709 [Gonioctena quinquepunctata]